MATLKLSLWNLKDITQSYTVCTAFAGQTLCFLWAQWIAQPRTSSITQAEAFAKLQWWRVWSLGCVRSPVSGPLFSASAWSLRKTSACAASVNTTDLWPHRNPSQWPLECLQTTLTVSLTAHCPHSNLRDVTRKKNYNKHSSNTRMHTQRYYPCCFQNVSSAWAVLIVLTVMNFL